MTLARRRFAVLCHENATERELRHYYITRLAEHWREDGHEVIFLFGVSTFVPADLVIVHVDLSVVPEPYLDFAQRYPIVLNGQIRDIRKSTFSKNLLRRDDSYGGRVIVKSDLNFGGIPERRLQEKTLGLVSLSSRVLAWYRERRGLQPEGPLQYRIYGDLQQVPRRVFGHKNLVVEKFLPEIDQGLYCVRNFHFLGDRTRCVRRRATGPIVNGTTFIDQEPVDPHPEIVAIRETKRWDYGKFDYVVVDDRVILLDVNKTVGLVRTPDTPEKLAQRREQAKGIYSYLR